MTDISNSSIRLIHPGGSETELFFVRHGRTHANVQQLFAGVTDVPLDDLGKRQAEAVARRFSNIQIDSIVSSPLQRAHYTAQSIGAVTGHTPSLDEGLKEMNFGDAEMMTTEEARARYPDLLPMTALSNDEHTAWPNGESRYGFQQRVISTVEAILMGHADQRVAVVCHGGVIANLLRYLGNVPADEFGRYPIENCSITHMSVLQQQTVLHSWNDHTHILDIAAD